MLVDLCISNMRSHSHSTYALPIPLLFHTSITSLGNYIPVLSFCLHCRTVSNWSFMHVLLYTAVAATGSIYCHQPVLRHISGCTDCRELAYARRCVKQCVWVNSHILLLAAKFFRKDQPRTIYTRAAFLLSINILLSTIYN